LDSYLLIEKMTERLNKYLPFSTTFIMNDIGQLFYEYCELLVQRAVRTQSEKNAELAEKKLIELSEKNETFKERSTVLFANLKFYTGSYEEAKKLL